MVEEGVVVVVVVRGEDRGRQCVVCLSERGEGPGGRREP